MISFIKSIFTGPKTSEKALDTASSMLEGIKDGFDHLNYSPEEKAKAYQKGLETFIEINKAVANENTQQSMARRDLSRWIVQAFIGLLLASAIVWPVHVAWAKYMLTLAELLIFLVTPVSVLYFGPHQLAKLKGRMPL